MNNGAGVRRNNFRKLKRIKGGSVRQIILFHSEICFVTLCVAVEDQLIFLYVKIVCKTIVCEYILHRWTDLFIFKIHLAHY